MNDLSLQRISELIRGVIELLWNRPDGLPGKEVIAYLPEIIKLTSHELAISPTAHIPRYERMVRIATTPLVKAGWLLKTDAGHWLLTGDGRQACKRFATPQEFFQEALKASEEFKKNAPEAILTLELLREKAWDAVTAYIRGKSIVEIRQLIADLLDAMQYHTVWVAPAQKDHGLIDLVANIDPLGANIRRILAQVKHTGQPVTAEGLKSLAAVLGPNDFGLCFSTGGFTPEAQNMINKGGYQKINAMTLEKFYELWIRHYDKLSLKAHQHLPLQAIFFLSPPE